MRVCESFVALLACIRTVIVGQQNGTIETEIFTQNLTSFQKIQAIFSGSTESPLCSRKLYSGFCCWFCFCFCFWFCLCLFSHNTGCWITTMFKKALFRKPAAASYAYFPTAALNYPSSYIQSSKIWANSSTLTTFKKAWFRQPASCCCQFCFWFSSSCLFSHSTGCWIATIFKQVWFRQPAVAMFIFPQHNDHSLHSSKQDFGKTAAH